MSSGQSVDDLIGALFPGEKKLPPAPAGVASASISQSWQKQPPPPPTHNFDDSDHEHSPVKKNHAPSIIQTSNNNNNNISSSFIPKKTSPITTVNNNNNNNGNYASSPYVPAHPSTFLPKASAVWPTLPKNLLRACEDSSVTLTSNGIPQRDILTHQRVLFPSSGSTPTTAQEQIIAERDSSIVSGDVQFCSYIRCKKCGHPVVRLQNAFVKAPKNISPNFQGEGQPFASKTHQQNQQKKEATKNSNNVGGHGFDDSSDEEENANHHSSRQNNNNHEKASSSSPGVLDEMYMVCRNHFPDFLALERTGKMKRMNDCAVYWCQCTMASVCSERNKMVKFTTIQSGNQNGKRLELPVAFVQSQMEGDAPYSTSEICWECVGHHKPVQ